MRILYGALSASARLKFYPHLAVSEPMPVAEIFDMPSVEGDEKSERLSDFARLDATVTVVDSATFSAELSSLDKLADRRMATGAGDQRSVVELLVDQV